MSELLHIDSLKIFLFFMAPGVIALYVRAQFLSGRMPPIAEGVVAYVMVAVAYHAVVYPISRYLYSSPDAAWSTAGWLLLILVGPALLGFLLGLNIRQGWTRWLLAKAGISTIHPINCAWDWRFGDCKESWALVSLKDGTKWAGFVGVNSFISSLPGERDIYIEKVYDHAEAAPWQPRVSSVWIAHGGIQSIEFWPNN